MKVTAYILSLMMIVSYCLFPQKVDAYESEFHEDITEHAIDESNLDSYLESNLGFRIEQKFKGPGWLYFSDTPSNKTIKDWIIYGSWKGDKPMGIGARASKHFYNPTYPLYPRYLNDMPTELLYQLNPNLISAWERAKIHTDDNEPYSWEDIKNYYYKALTTENERINRIIDGTIIYSRNWNFAQTFRGVGQVLHLLQDMGVPAHVRNDNHVPIVAGKDTYEERIISILPAPIPSPVKFDTFDHYWDSDVNANAYGDGLAEYTNYNFLSDDTIFKDSTDSLHYFEHPDKDNTDYSYFDALMPEVVVAEDGKNDIRYYIHPKAGTYAPVYIAALGYFATEMDSAGTGYWKKACIIDDLVADAYARKLVPKTISYSAGLINYFFRGKFETSPEEEVTGTKVTITNKSGEKINGGVLKLYYDYKKKGEEETKRFEVPEYSSPDADLNNLVLNDGDDFTLNFSPIIGAGNYIIVFKGIVGQEEAIIGKVFKAKFPSITELMRAINEREAVTGLSQTEFYNRTTGESLGVPDGGVNVPVLDALDGCPLVIQDLRYPIQRLAPYYWSGLYDTNNTPVTFNWAYLSPGNLYHIAMGEGWDWGYFGEEMYIKEILKCIEKLEWIKYRRNVAMSLFKKENTLYDDSESWAVMLGNAPDMFSHHNCSVIKELWEWWPGGKWGAVVARGYAKFPTSILSGKLIQEAKHSFEFHPLVHEILGISLPTTIIFCKQAWGYPDPPWSAGNIISSVSIDSSETKFYSANILPEGILTTEDTSVVCTILNDEVFPGCEMSFEGRIDKHYVMVKPQWNYPTSP